MLKYLVFVVEVHGADDFNFNHKRTRNAVISRRRNQKCHSYLLYGVESNQSILLKVNVEIRDNAQR